MPTLTNMEKVNGIVISGASAPTDRHILLGTQTASSSATLSFSGLNSHRSDVLRSSFDELEFRFMNMHPGTNAAKFSFQVNATDGAGFNDSLITSTTFMAYHGEDDSYGRIDYSTGDDLAQQALYQTLCPTTSDDDDASMSGVLTLYAPSSTTYVKHFTARTTDYSSNGPLMYDFYTAGYINDTTAIDEISFMFHTGEIAGGEIKMYGIAKS